MRRGALPCEAEQVEAKDHVFSFWVGMFLIYSLIIEWTNSSLGGRVGDLYIYILDWINPRANLSSTHLATPWTGRFLILPWAGVATEGSAIHALTAWGKDEWNIRGSLLSNSPNFKNKKSKWKKKESLQRLRRPLFIFTPASSTENGVTHSKVLIVKPPKWQAKMPKGFIISSHWVLLLANQIGAGIYVVGAGKEALLWIAHGMEKEGEVLKTTTLLDTMGFHPNQIVHMFRISHKLCIGKVQSQNLWELTHCCAPIHKISIVRRNWNIPHIDHGHHQLGCGCRDTCRRLGLLRLGRLSRFSCADMLKLLFQIRIKLWLPAFGSISHSSKLFWISCLWHTTVLHTNQKTGKGASFISRQRSGRCLWQTHCTKNGQRGTRCWQSQAIKLWTSSSVGFRHEQTKSMYSDEYFPLSHVTRKQGNLACWKTKTRWIHDYGFILTGKNYTQTLEKRLAKVIWDIQSHTAR